MTQSENRNGGIQVTQNTDAIKVKVINYQEQIIQCDMEDTGSRDKISLTFVYGLNIVAD